LIADKVAVLPLVTVGASFTAVTVEVKVPVFDEKAVVPPLLVVSAVRAVEPELAVPLVWSQAL
jgi:hypothetical protein